MRTRSKGRIESVPKMVPTNSNVFSNGSFNVNKGMMDVKKSSITRNDSLFKYNPAIINEFGKDLEGFKKLDPSFD